MCAPCLSRRERGGCVLGTPRPLLSLHPSEVFRRMKPVFRRVGVTVVLTSVSGLPQCYDLREASILFASVTEWVLRVHCSLSLSLACRFAQPGVKAWSIFIVACHVWLLVRTCRSQLLRHQRCSLDSSPLICTLPNTSPSSRLTTRM